MGETAKIVLNTMSVNASATAEIAGGMLLILQGGARLLEDTDVRTPSHLLFSAAALALETSNVLTPSLCPAPTSPSVTMPPASNGILVSGGCTLIALAAFVAGLLAAEWCPSGHQHTLIDSVPTPTGSPAAGPEHARFKRLQTGQGQPADLSQLSQRHTSPHIASVYVSIYQP